MKKILITGINGFLGRHLAFQLKHKFQIIGLYRSYSNITQLNDACFKFYQYGRDSLESIFVENTIDIVIHAATNYGKENENTVDLIHTNIILPVELYELSQKYGSSLFVNVDTFMNKPEKIAYLERYVLSKQQIIDWLKILQTKCKIINMIIYHQYGPHDVPHKFIPIILRALKTKNTIDLTSGEQSRDFIYIDDVVSAFSCILDVYQELDSFSEFHIGTGKSTSIREFVETAKNILDSNATLHFGSIPYRKNEIMHSQAKNEDLIALGWKPQYLLKEGLVNLIEKEHVHRSNSKYQ
jgi:nucleoside-diphosphate-sugar epimerase